MLSINYIRDTKIEGMKSMEDSRNTPTSHDVITISCCSEGDRHIQYAMKIVSAIVKKSSEFAPPAQVDMKWGGRSQNIISIRGTWKPTGIIRFLNMASSKDAVRAGSWSERAIHYHRIRMEHE
jgi:hypothetical protein